MSRLMRHRSARGFTLAEVLTVLVVLAILAAVAIPTWRVHQLRVRRAEAIAALVSVQTEQDRYFGRNARYADGTQLSAAPPDGLGIANESTHGFYRIELRLTADALAYLATARATERAGIDTRCVEFTIDQNGRRRAQDAKGVDRSADCWH